MRMSSLGGALLLQSKGLETVMQVCCRDRNRLALQGDLLAAQALGVPTVMAVAGEEITHGDHHQAKPCNDLDLLELLARHPDPGSRAGTWPGWTSRGRPSSWWAPRSRCRRGGAALEAELAELDKKIAAGARFFTTPPVFDAAALEGFRKQVGNRQAAIIPTVLLLKSVGMARYINRHLDQMKIPEDSINRIHKAADRVRECVQIAGETVAALKDKGYPGVLISTIGWEDKLPAILAAAGV